MLSEHNRQINFFFTFMHLYAKGERRNITSNLESLSVVYNGV